MIKSNSNSSFVFNKVIITQTTFYFAFTSIYIIIPCFNSILE